MWYKPLIHQETPLIVHMHIEVKRLWEYLKY